MVDEDKIFVKKCLAAGMIKSPCLELGGNYETSKQFFTEPIDYLTSDIEPGKCDVVATFGNGDLSAFEGRMFKTVIALNILEHTFEPIRVLDDIFSLILPGGSCVLTSPVIWPLHDYPNDFCRLNPHWYEEYARRRGLELALFEFIGMGNVQVFAINGQYVLPVVSNRFKAIRSRVVHRLFDTTGRDYLFKSHIQLGSVLAKRTCLQPSS